MLNTGHLHNVQKTKRSIDSNIMALKQKAVVLSSGGIDSTTAMAIAKDEDYEIYSLSFFYGQRHALELKAAQKVAEAVGVAKHLVINIDLKKIGGSSLTDEIDVPKDRNETEMIQKIPITYVPEKIFPVCHSLRPLIEIEDTKLF